MPWAVYLDSGQPGSHYGHYDIMAAKPVTTLVTEGEHTEIRTSTGMQVSDGDPFQLLKQTLASYAVTEDELPFCGGAIGYFGYDLARRLECLPTQTADSEKMPQMMIGIYDWAVVVDHRARRAFLVSHAQHANTRDRWPVLCDLFTQPAANAHGEFKVTSAVASNMSLAAYTAAFDRIQQYIHAGDCYQV
ncbi:MAG TPA: aminodeoxychorismate synthase component I, partial [Methylophilaceae bacterium]|nr:aminodeoxychorismate synthase component I [Methylophilaceae bacterium]